MSSKNQNKKQLNQNDISNLVRDRNFLLGLGVFIALLLFLGVGITKYTRSLSEKKVVAKNSTAVQKMIGNTNSKVISPIASATATPSTQEISSSSAKPKLAVKELPNTSGITYYTVVAHDNFWKISKLMCGTGVYYLSIQQYNGYQNIALHPGDVLTIVCEQ